MLLAQIIISVLLFLILFFGIGFLLNMLLKTTWLPGLILYPIVVLMMVKDKAFVWSVQEEGQISILNPGEIIRHLAEQIAGLLYVDYIILGAGLLGAILSGLAIRLLRQKGYRMF
ncbi:YuiB family protein [Caldalkalibacillus salinus]|uniref:YuiB family protein n=1 Tax=Caldalkalibacillus salinus TaxID=2803787 RepID=UPI001920E764|nr:YuiB family protein [Caldalkalibacillus salinus]